MQKRYRQGEAESYTESGEEEAKGGENVQKINREDVVQAALIVERWCREQKTKNDDGCSCPFFDFVDGCMMINIDPPADWNLDGFLRIRGLRNG